MRREMAHPVPTKGFLWLSQEVAMLSQPGVKTHQPPPCPALSASTEPKSQRIWHMVLYFNHNNSSFETACAEILSHMVDSC